MISELEQSFPVQLSESDLILIVSLLWVAEKDLLLKSRLAAAVGNGREELARRESAAKALELADRLAFSGGAA